MLIILSVLAVAIILVSIGDMLLAHGMKKSVPSPPAPLRPFPGWRAGFHQSFHHYRHYLPGRLFLPLAGHPFLVRP